MLEDRALPTAQPNGGRLVAELGGEIVNPLMAPLAAHSEWSTSHNLVLPHIMRAVPSMLRQGVIENREKLFSRPETRGALRAQHRAVHEAVMAGDEDAAAAAAESHIHYTDRALKEIAAAKARLEISLRRISSGEMGVKPGGRRR